VQTTAYDGEPEFSTFVFTHILLILSITGSFVLWMVVNSSYPDFFNPFQFWLLTDDIPGALIQNWPFFLYCIVLSTIAALFLEKKRFNHEIVFAQDIYTSVMAGILEEVGYRCLFIFTAMVGITVFNFITMGLVMWLYQNLIFPFTDMITLGLMHDHIYGLPILFAAGVLSANAGFRDGHKYAGIVGYVNSWFVGFYLICVMLSQGLVIAILVHMIYDLIVAVMKYGRNKISVKNRY